MHRQHMIIENDVGCYYVHGRTLPIDYASTSTLDGTKIKQPSIAIPHNYESTSIIDVVFRIKKSSYLACLVEVRNWMHQEGKYVANY